MKKIVTITVVSFALFLTLVVVFLIDRIDTILWLPTEKVLILDQNTLLNIQTHLMVER